MVLLYTTYSMQPTYLQIGNFSTNIHMYIPWIRALLCLKTLIMCNKYFVLKNYLTNIARVYICVLN